MTIAIVCLPLYYIYFGNEIQALKSDTPNPFGKLTVLTMGNLGSSTMFCDNKRLLKKKLIAECPVNTEFNYDHYKYGILDVDSKKSSYCREEAIWKHESPDLKNCTKYINN